MAQTKKRTEVTKPSVEKTIRIILPVADDRTSRVVLISDSSERVEVIPQNRYGSGASQRWEDCGEYEYKFNISDLDEAIRLLKENDQ